MIELNHNPAAILNGLQIHTMKKKLFGSEYKSVQEFIDDIQLICDNAKLSNGSTSVESQILQMKNGINHY
jgi:hypothetical protein